MTAVTKLLHKSFKKHYYCVFQIGIIFRFNCYYQNQALLNRGLSEDSAQLCMHISTLTLRKKSQCSEFFWSVFSRTQIDSRDLPQSFL